MKLIQALGKPVYTEAYSGARKLGHTDDGKLEGTHYLPGFPYP